MPTISNRVIELEVTAVVLSQKDNNSFTQF